MKARDIVAGWPKGRSTSSARKWLYVRIGPWDEKAERDNFVDQQYHAAQQRMVTTFIEGRFEAIVEGSGLAVKRGFFSVNLHDVPVCVPWE